MRQTTVLWLLFSHSAFASQKIFSVNDDVFAYPQYEIDFSSSYVLEDDAAIRLQASRLGSRGDAKDIAYDSSDDPEIDYEQMILHDRRYLCSIPHVKPFENATEEKQSEEDQQKELIHAADRGWNLLQDMEGKQCLYYSTGWWSYAFCYNSYVKQFHSLPPSPGGARNWPPQEDAATPSYFLGKYSSKAVDKDSPDVVSNNEVALQTRADGNYLVQKLEGGTPCDLTGKNRKVEIEFHCHPQTTDRIGWIKETTTCAYLMVVYTPRLCNDVAFQPSRDSQAHTITCQEILSISQAADLNEDLREPLAIEQSEEKPIVVGNIELGGMKYVGKDGKKIERGRVVMTAEEKAEVIIMQKDGQIQGLSRSKLKELNLKPEEIEQFKKELQKIAGSNDWKVERLVDENGQVILQGIVSSDDDEDGTSKGDEVKKKKEKSKETEDGIKDEL